MSAAPPALDFRMMQPADLDAVTAIESESFPDVWTREAIEHWMIDPRGWARVALAGSTVAAFVVAIIEDRTMHVANLAVRASFRRRGVAHALLAHVLDQAMRFGLTDVLLEVRTDNLPARRLYEGAGFNVVGTLRRYYGDGDALRMTRPLRNGP